ncbi:unnamed protein product [Rangifer tarandus platyrhynchus]|uniref:Uncharacterized protein n=2 Tax=Rangifer tarandus platyrhynchus TaxID=3082113 RepID=A0AC60A1A3_RANTA|nr:unnamed protein product [Rangifer tarandus platyrhynchus]
MCDEHVFTARSSQAMPESGVKATVGSLSLSASGLLSAVSRFFHFSVCPFCSAVFVWKPSPPRACVSRSLLGQYLPLPPHSGPGSHSPCSAPGRSPTCSPQSCCHLPGHHLPLVPRACLLVTRQRGKRGRKESPKWWSPHLGLSSSHPSSPRAWLPAHLPLGGPELGDRCFREEEKNDEGWQGLKSHLHSLPPVPAGLLNLKMWIKTCEHCRGEESLPTLGPTTHCRKGSVWKRRASSCKLRAGIAVCKPEGNWAAAGIPGPHLPFLM